MNDENMDSFIQNEKIAEELSLDEEAVFNPTTHKAAIQKLRNSDKKATRGGLRGYGKANKFCTPNSRIVIK